MIVNLLNKLARRDMLDEHERAVLMAAPAGTKQFGPRRNIVRQGEPLTQSMLLLDGFVCRYIDLADGKRQILEFHMPGDFIDLQGFLLKSLEHNMASVSPVTVALVPHTTLRHITENEPHLTRLLWFTTLIDAAIHRQWIVSNGRRSAIARVAHLMCELDTRLDVAGLSDGNSFFLPFTQADIADATGLTSIHVNRMLRVLRDDGVMTFRDGRVTITNRPALADIAEFDPAYLYLHSEPR
ncbi:Crp/Fnr family transcriptional regulator [Sphingomonas sp. XMGL2]|uniref:Crp/Fnr family transcriptional regulator n=2 Tax=Sphingomonas quercus TaxID=2842451 RepID=A0ABS6BKH5_9SPHN|nr:Crp/Fnr family transcriptional regulator [Sphingomonas quercus]